MQDTHEVEEEIVKSLINKRVEREEQRAKRKAEDEHRKMRRILASWAGLGTPHSTALAGVWLCMRPWPDVGGPTVVSPFLSGGRGSRVLLCLEGLGQGQQETPPDRPLQRRQSGKPTRSNTKTFRVRAIYRL